MKTIQRIYSSKNKNAKSNNFEGRKTWSRCRGSVVACPALYTVYNKGTVPSRSTPCVKLWESNILKNGPLEHQRWSALQPSSMTYTVQKVIQICNMKCRGKRDTTGNIPRSIMFSLLHFMLFRGKIDFLWDSAHCTVGTVHSYVHRILLY